jgi:hypothetical protein
MLSVCLWIPPYQLLNACTWAHLSGILQKFLPSVCVSVCVPLSVLDNGSVKTLSPQRIHSHIRIAGRVVFYAVRVESKESKWLVLHRTSCFLTFQSCFPGSQWLKTGFGLVIGFINHLQVVTTINYYTISDLHNVQSLHANLFSLSALVFTDL